ncbi:MAG: nucleotide sugar dehydrogenase, partial [Candidatus Ranarchaeia archaeon]
MPYRISIAGTGFVGLVTAACFASKDIEVYATNFINKETEELIRQGVPHFFEKGLKVLLQRVRKADKLKVFTSIDQAIPYTDITFITEGTPMQDDKKIDLKYIRKAARQIGNALVGKDDYHLIVVKSTVVPGTTRNVLGKIIAEESGKKAGKDFGLCMNPEFLREGCAIHDTLHPDRIVIGELFREDGKLLEKFFTSFYDVPPPPILHMSLESAELVKYASNTFLATKISFVNELAALCETIPDVDIKDVVKAMSFDYRINPHFLNAGVGFGGSCFPK